MASIHLFFYQKNRALYVFTLLVLFECMQCAISMGVCNQELIFA